MTKYLPTLAAAAVDVLTSADPHQKVSKTYELAGNWRESDLALGQCRPPDRPSRPLLPRLCAPREMPKRSTGPKEASNRPLRARWLPTAPTCVQAGKARLNPALQPNNPHAP